jgi:hypothetical protein
MPIGDTLTLLATLASAFQALRTSRPDEPPAAGQDAIIDPTLLIALDAANAANDEVVLRHETAGSRLLWLTGLSAAALLLSAFLGAVSSDSADAASPLFILSLIVFVVVVAVVIVIRRVFTLSSPEADDTEALASQEVVEKLLHRRRQLERRNSRRLAVVDIGVDAVLGLVALQVILAALWLID